MIRGENVQEDFASNLVKNLSEPENLSPAKEIITQNKAFEKLCYDDYRSRLESRKNYGRLIVALLIIQNLSIYTLIGYLAGWNIAALQQLQWLFSVLVSGTLTETYFVFNHVIRWLFNEVDYKPFVYPPVK